MYRLVKFPSFKVSRPKNVNCKVSTAPCTMCGITNLKPGISKINSIQSRGQHGNINTHVDYVAETVKKKRGHKKDKKSFTELLEILRNEYKQTRASVQNLKPQDIARIVTSPGIDLDHFHQIKTKNYKKIVIPNEARYSEACSLPLIKDANNCTTTQGNDIPVRKSSVTPVTDTITPGRRSISTESTNLEDYLEIHNLSLVKPSNFDAPFGKMDSLQGSVGDLNRHLNTKTSNISLDPLTQERLAEEFEHIRGETEDDVVSDQQTEGTKGKNTTKNKKFKDELAKEKISELEMKCRAKAFNTTLIAYLNLCVSCNFLQRGLVTLNHYIYRSKVSKSFPKISDVRVFESLMRGYAATGNHVKMNELFKMMMSLGLHPSITVMALHIECAARSQKPPNVIAGLLKLFQNLGFELNSIFTECTFVGDQQEMILKAIREVLPHFQPDIPPPSICYSCALLQEINEKQGNLKSPAEGVVTRDQLLKFAEEQMNYEMACDLKVKSIEKKIEHEGILEFNRHKLEAMKACWVKELKSGFHREVSILEKSKNDNSVGLLPYFRALEPQSYIDIMLKEIERLAEGSETFSPTTFSLYRNLGLQVKQRYIIKHKKSHGIMDKTKMLYGQYCDWYLNPGESQSRNGRQEWQRLVHHHHQGPSIEGSDDYWPGTVLMGIGRFLYNIIINDVKIDVNILNKKKPHLLPAFYRVYRQQGVRSVEEIKPHPIVSRLYRAAAPEHILFDITQVPMVSPPLPWTSHNSGGYLVAKTELIRLPDQALQQRKRLKEAPPNQLYPPLDSLNQLGSIPWRVNVPVLDVVIEVFNNGGSGKLDIPEPPHLGAVAEPVTPEMTKEERFQAFRQRMVLRRQKAEMYSLWCDALYKLSLANHFRDRVFWLPHNMDFRGRVYPCPPHLNHLGADMSRSLLCFAQGKPLGPDGLNWLKIHLVNLLGTKKRVSVQERLEYANTIMTEILDSAENPLTGYRWWMDSETPWQTLSCCKEIRNAVQHPGGPSSYVSHFPIHQDGSCNGLQHYAALGRDEAGANSVNLAPQPLPQDVYSCVAALVEQARAKDSAAGMAVAKELDGFVRRKVIKQTVMTTVYGVTRFGARLQIAKQLKDIDSFPKEYVWQASAYLVVKTFESLREMFNSTKEIQDWFTECARLVSTVCGENMEYVTPLGLPVVQYYTRTLKRPDHMTMKIGRLQEFFPMDMFERPNVMKQKNAFPPNFIHSLDSSHMMLTSIFSEQRGITFVSVHDCYWTHACTVPIMNQICREQFVSLHSQPILEDLSQFMLKKYYIGGREELNTESKEEASQKLCHVLSRVPPKGTFLLENVLDSVYFFS